MHEWSDFSPAIALLNQYLHRDVELRERKLQIASLTIGKNGSLTPWFSISHLTVLISMARNFAVSVHSPLSTKQFPPAAAARRCFQQKRLADERSKTFRIIVISLRRT